jgi:hypothetical protein
VKTVIRQHLLFLNTWYTAGTLSILSMPQFVTLQMYLFWFCFSSVDSLILVQHW